MALVKLGDVAEIKKGNALTKENTRPGNIKVVAGGIDFAYYHDQYNRLEGTITISASGANAGFVNYWKEKIYASDCTTIRENSNLSNVYIYIVLKYWFQQYLLSLARGAAQPHVYAEDIKKILIPNVNEDIQQQIIDECEKIEEQVNILQDNIDNINKQIVSLFIPIFDLDKKIKLASLAILLKRGRSTKYGKTNVQVIKSGQARGYEEFDFTNKFYAQSESILDERTLQKGDLLINSTGVGTAGRVTLFNLDGIYVADSHITILRPNVKIAYPKYILYCLAFIGFKNIEKLAKGSSGQIELTLSTIENIQIPLLELNKQLDVIREIELLEKRVKEAKEIIKNVPAQKRAILEKYL